MENWTHAYHLATTSLTVSLAVSDPPGLHFLAADTQEEALTDALNHHQLANYLKIHDLEQAAIFIEETLAPHRAVKLTAEEWRYLHTQILVTIVDTISEETRSQVLALDPFQKMDRLMYKQKDLRPFFLDLLRVVEEHEEQTERRSSSLIDEVDHYINAHYADPALNLNRLGDLFHISPTYLAKQYKELRGSALVDQLNKRRIREAKRYLMEDPEMMLVDVAERCGFTNMNTFIRVFKKMEGITPGRYRDSQASTS